MAKLSDSEQRAIIGERLSNTLSTTDAELRRDRIQALDHYYGRPYGNELEGRSQVVTKDLMDIIEWMMPSLLRIFATRDAVQFDPVGPEDEELAKQETAYVSHVLWKKNPGFMLIYKWLKDGLMQKVGYVKHSWVEENKVCFEPYSGLDDNQLQMVFQDLQARGEVEVAGQQQAPDGTWSVKFKVKEKYGCEKITVCQPDEIKVDAKCRDDVKSAQFVGHLRDDLTNSDLLEMGYTRKQLTALTDYVWQDATNGENLARDTVSENTDQEDQNSDWATRKRRLLECYTYVDADGDGIAELRHYLAGGNDFLENEEFPEIPFCSWTPIPVPHRHVGLSIDDTMEDQQRINTALNRGMLDNIYFTMNPRVVYDKNTVDVESLGINRPGGHVSNDGPPMGAITPMPVNPMAGQILPVIEYTAQTLEKRTGVGRMTSGVDADVLAQSTKGAYIDAKSASNQRIEAIARIFAETGLAQLFSSIHRDLCRHQDHEVQFKLKDKNWITVNPTEWRERTDLTVSVGLGNSSRDEIRQNLSLMATAQEKLRAGDPGLVQSKNMYALFRRFQTEMGFENDEFATDPSSPQYKQYQQSQAGAKDPFVQGEEIKAQANMAGKQLDAQVKREQMAQDRDLKITEMELDAHVDIAKAGIGAEVAVARGAAKAGGNGTAAAGQSGTA